MLSWYPIQPRRIYRNTDTYKRTVLNPNWVLEYKYDDWRCLVEYTDAGVVAYSRRGTILTLEPQVKSLLEKLPVSEGGVLDSCLLGKRDAGVQECVAFDIPVWEGERLTEDLNHRRARLERLAADGLRISERMPNTIDAFERALEVPGVEGIVCKLVSAPPKFAGRPDQHDPSWLKVKVDPHYVPGTNGAGGHLSPKPPKVRT